MTVAVGRAGAVVFSAVAMLSMLLGLAALALGHPERTAIYLAVTFTSAVIVGVLMRRDVRRRRATGELPPRRVPRRPIAFPIRETTITFAVWYLIAVAIDRVVTGMTNVFTLVAIAPFASFMLTTLTIAGRHMAFRLTAEDVAAGGRAQPDQRERG
jgi:amino acid transporter